MMRSLSKRPRAWLALLFLAFGVVSAGEAQAQNAVITGQVVSDANRPVPRANVAIPEIGVTATTDESGNYSIVVPAARVAGQAVTVRVRAIGFTPEVRQIRLTSGTQRADFSIRSDVVELTEVVVTGVAEGVEQAKVPFSVARVDTTDMPAPAISPLAQLQGRVAGVSIVGTTGRPGEDPCVLLRAPTSINAFGRGQAPLFVVDGVVLGGGLSDINPADVESIEIIKGAAASSFYGATAGSGVIQVRTKRGRGLQDNAIKFGLRTEYGVSDIEREIPLSRTHVWRMNADKTLFCANLACTQTFNWADEILFMNSTAEPSPQAARFSPILGAGLPIGASGATVWNTFQINAWPEPTYNPIDQLVDPGSFAQADLSMTGKINQTNFFASLGRMDQQGSILSLEGFRRTSARINIDQAIADAWTVQLSTFYSRSKQDGQGLEGTGSVMFDLTRMPRTVNLLQRDTVRGDIIIRPDLNSENENPLYQIEAIDADEQNDRFLGGLDVRFAPSTWFEVRATGSYDRAHEVGSEFRDKGFRTARPGTLNLGFLEEFNETNETINTALMATTRFQPTADLRATLQARSSFQREDIEFAEFEGQNLAVRSVRSAQNADPTQTDIFSGETLIRRLGFFLNGILDFKDRYYLDALVRRDGSSLFGPGNRWHTFGRAAASWRISHEPWFRIPGLDEVKLRYAIGTAGNSPNFAAQYETYLVTDGRVGAPFTAGNRQLGPEFLTEQEAGLDLLLFGRLGAQLTYSDVVTKDQILLVPLPAPSGFQFQWQNAGTLEGNTFEASLDIPWIRGPDLTFSTRLNYDRSRATITELTVPPYQTGVGTQAGNEAAGAQALHNVFFVREGERYGTFYGRRWATSCADLPQGVDCSPFRVNSDGYLVWTGGADPGSGAFRNPDGSVAVRAGTWGTSGPLVRGSAVLWGVPLQAQDADGNTYLPLGNALPDARWSIMPQLGFRRFSMSALFDAVVGRDIWNQANHWATFENFSAGQDQIDKPDEELKPIGYYGSTGLYESLFPNSHFVEDGSFVKFRELTLSYRVGQFGMGDWIVSLIGRNLKTWTDYSGFDPEVGRRGGSVSSGVIAAFDSFQFPNLRTWTLGLQASF